MSGITSLENMKNKLSSSLSTLCKKFLKKPPMNLCGLSILSVLCDHAVCLGVGHSEFGLFLMFELLWLFKNHCSILAIRE